MNSSANSCIPDLQADARDRGESGVAETYRAWREWEMVCLQRIKFRSVIMRSSVSTEVKNVRAGVSSLRLETPLHTCHLAPRTCSRIGAALA
jgi:hypothetical protein